jgi:putative glycerol-1-phosphate prenyltransferase
LKNQIREWRHVFKLDPERTISDSHLEQICCSGTHAVMVGGSSGITFENTVDLLSRIRRYEVSCVLEVSEQDAVVPGFDFYFIPFILNTQDTDWLIGRHHQAIKELGPWLQWDQMVTEGYVVLNENSTVAKKTRAQTHLDEKDLAAYVKMADRLFYMDIVYIEYSGRFGDLSMLQQARQACGQARLFYGGGIQNLAGAKAASDIADTIVVGNIIYENIDQALDTVKVIEQN